MSDYWDLLPIGREVTFKGRVLIIKSIWNDGVVFKIENDVVMWASGDEDFKQIKGV